MTTCRTAPYRWRIGLACCWLAGTALPATGPAQTDRYRAEIETWRRDRVRRLTAEDGWLTLIGLYWLEEGPNTMGSDPANDLVLPASKAPGLVGTLHLVGPEVRLEVAPGVAVTEGGRPVSSAILAADTTGDPTVLDLGDLRFFLIERSRRRGLRIRDRAHPARLRFDGIDSYSIDSRWRIVGRLERHEPPRTIPVPTVLGTVNQQASPGTVVFELEGSSHRLDALDGPDGGLFLIFADRTSGRGTYGGGRFLYSDPVAADGSVVLDFNKAYNPPCAFTDYATCPLPPRQNKLPIAVQAGEKGYDRHH